jgi:CBS domain-containing protein
MKRTTVRELMTRDVITLQKGQSMPTAEELLRLLRIRHLPVVDREGKLVGLVTHRQLLQAHVNLLAELGSADEDAPEDKIPVRRVMQSEVLTISPDHDAATALELMLSEKVGSLPVLEDGRVVGIITSKDFLAFQLRKLRAESGDAASGTLEDDPPTIPDAPPAAPEAPERRQGPPPAGATRGPAVVRVRRVGSVLAGIVLLGVGLGLGLLAARHLRPAPASSPSPTATDAVIAMDGAPATLDVAGQVVPRLDAGDITPPAIDQPEPAPPRPGFGLRPRPDLRSRPDVRSRSDARSRPPDLRAHAPSADPKTPVWIPEKIRRR